MTNDPLQRVVPGQPVKHSAELWNALIDAARSNRARELSRPGGPIESGFGNQTIRIQNDSGSAVDRFAVLAIGLPIIPPEDSLDQFQSRIAFAGTTPTSSTESGKWCVTLEPIPAGEIGRAVLSGVVPVQVDATAGAEDFAEFNEDTTSCLVCDAGGTARILWLETTGEVCWAVVRLGDAAGGGGGSLTVKETDGSPSYSSITTVEVNQADGFVLTQPGAGRALVSISDASTVTPGIVSLGTQYIKGEKYFEDKGHYYFSLSPLNELEIHCGTGGYSKLTAWVNRGVGGPTEQSTFIGITPGGMVAVEGTEGAIASFYWIAGTGHPAIAVGGVGDDGVFVVNGTEGASGTDGLGSVFDGGICTTVGSGSGPTGPTGPTGATGATGATGPAGADGADGADGDPGPNLVDGSTATTLTGILKGNGSAVGTVTVGTGLSYSGSTLSCTVSGISDGDKGDITVSGSGATWTIDSNAISTAKIADDAVTYAKLQNVSATSRILGRKTASAGDTEECTLSEILDFIGSAAQGDVLYRGASAWARLAAGTSGQVLTTGGTGANPSWTTAIPSGTVNMFAGSSAPTGWLLCDGAAVSRTTYAALFTAISTTWGVGDGSTTFNVPDMRGRTPIGVGTGSGLTARSLAGSGGTETHTLTTGEMPSHDHMPAVGEGFWIRDFTTASLDVQLTFTAPGDHRDGGRAPTAATGGGGAHANMQPWRAINFVIKT